MNQAPTAPHVSDEQLAALNDGQMAEREADSLRDHLQGCQDCRSRQQQLEDLGARLAQAPEPSPALVRRITAAAVDEAEARPAFRSWLFAAPALAAAAGVLLLVWPSGAPIDGPDGWQARGETPATAPVHFNLFRHDGELAQLRDGAELKAGEHRLTASVRHLPADRPRSVAIYTRAADGRITWIRPTWTDVAARPSCLRLPKGAGVIEPSQGVTLRLAPGKVEVGMLVLEGDCDIPSLDARLEAGWRPATGADKLLSAQQLTLIVE